MSSESYVAAVNQLVECNTDPSIALETSILSESINYKDTIEIIEKYRAFCAEEQLQQCEAHKNKDSINTINTATSLFMQFAEPHVYTTYMDLVDMYIDRGFFGSKRYADFLNMVVSNIDILYDPSTVIDRTKTTYTPSEF